MKVQNQAIFMGDSTRSERHQQISKEQDRQNGQKNIFAGGLNGNLDPIARKQQEAKKQVMKIIGDARESDRKIEDGLAESRNNIKKHRKTIEKANDELKLIEEARQELKEHYGIEEDSQEEQDLKLLEKQRKSFKGDSQIELTEQEKERIAQIEEEGLTEYQQRSMDLLNSGSPYEEEISEAKKQIEAENGAISVLKEATLKSKAMIKAQKAADEVMDAARDEIVGMLVDEAKDHIDEEMEEKKEAAEEKAEKEKEEEEKVEKRKEDKEEKEAFAEQVAASTELVIEAEKSMEDVQREVKKIMDDMKLLEEDLKGAAVDTSK
ncbi:MAG: hypothetical protein K2H52_07590 [Lachnospiraceae bacterium]|nr:hypothetical protein [Lachnospiraceae bacterium]MDE7287727.1 hypothetical protein [Lachnospiraceae bacterium]